jgi:hypothetical protein
MPERRPAAAPLRAPASPPCLREDDQLVRTAERIAIALERLQPAADTLHGFGDRADALCKWFRGKWPWIGLFVGSLLVRGVNMSPEDAHRLVGGLADLAKALGGQG